MTEDDIVRIPQLDKWVGSCPICGKTIWESYLNPKTIKYRCIECKEEITPEQVIPF